jgi:hypothetical protein
MEEKEREKEGKGDACGGGVEACRWRRRRVERVVLTGVEGDAGESGVLTVYSDGGEGGGGERVLLAGKREVGGRRCRARIRKMM